MKKRKVKRGYEREEVLRGERDAANLQASLTTLKKGQEGQICFRAWWNENCTAQVSKQCFSLLSGVGAQAGCPQDDSRPMGNTFNIGDDCILQTMAYLLPETNY